MILGCVFKTLFNKIAAELFDKTHEVRTVMLSSKNETVFFSDMPVLGLFNYRKFLFQRLKVLMQGFFR